MCTAVGWGALGPQPSGDSGPQAALYPAADLTTLPGPRQLTVQLPELLLCVQRAQTKQTEIVALTDQHSSRGASKSDV